VSPGVRIKRLGFISSASLYAVLRNNIDSVVRAGLIFLILRLGDTCMHITLKLDGDIIFWTVASRNMDSGDRCIIYGAVLGHLQRVDAKRLRAFARVWTDWRTGVRCSSSTTYSDQGIRATHPELKFALNLGQPECGRTASVVATTPGQLCAQTIHRKII
jgi:hypothetical protein